ncbi:hypothetical protein [Propionivibrio sp.]|uniref:hypothetical protein n=1 Tax=Propionivibrio sp. TaxID=2212460 RepID=UPI0025F54FD0|nr:hypothetical protein [Propionivibrio sp.]MBK7357467.1 hypothetical protein [Propionivibrio sp.]
MIETKQYQDGTTATGRGPLPYTSPKEQEALLHCGISRAEWHDKAWALYHAKTFDDQALAKVSIHTIRAVFDATYDALKTPNA